MPQQAVPSSEVGSVSESVSTPMISCSDGAPTILWLGGSSCLARTFHNTFDRGDGDEWGHSSIGREHSTSRDTCERNGEGIVDQVNANVGARMRTETNPRWNLIYSGKETNRPDWLRETRPFRTLDLSDVGIRAGIGTKASTSWRPAPNTVQVFIVGIRPKLFARQIHEEEEHQAILKGLETLIREQSGSLRYILHISSVAAADHLKAQRFESECSPASPRPSAPYDRFKYDCEQLLNTVDIPCTHLRLGAIFSDDERCIQCNALGLQSRIGSYLPIPIDCNSSRNVACAIHHLLRSRRHDAVYYYTRPLHLPRPVAYGYYLDQYRAAHEIRHWITVPQWLVSGFTQCVHALARWLPRVPYLDAADYLLQVASREHSFDCSKMKADFPTLVDHEESIVQCFRRRRRWLMLQQRKRGPTVPRRPDEASRTAGSATDFHRSETASISKQNKSA
uniref:Uncharacterized protein n=1 Tax=Craspedostauros australis TaxID=1486917 RepID=A0A7R9WTB5_9STRA|mmetsp:Transcript_18466/g.51338  ORF Transcript_18466/g.51338 Transcript_18466/m.51338 type:complete len:451 (+) Transcript_18466:189-1541(+)